MKKAGSVTLLIGVIDEQPPLDDEHKKIRTKRPDKKKATSIFLIASSKPITFSNLFN